MSIKRYTISGLHPHIIEDKNGFMVYYEDYARTKADVGELADALILASEVGIKMADEVTRLKTLTVEMDKTINISQAGCRELKTEVERLRKAGDNLARAIDDNGCHDNGDWYDQQNAIHAWNAAKEGKQS